jgi:hypothetical protein
VKESLFKTHSSKETLQLKGRWNQKMKHEVSKIEITNLWRIRDQKLIRLAKWEFKFKSNVKRTNLRRFTQSIKTHLCPIPGEISRLEVLKVNIYLPIKFRRRSAKNYAKNFWMENSGAKILVQYRKLRLRRRKLKRMFSAATVPQIKDRLWEKEVKRATAFCFEDWIFLIYLNQTLTWHFPNEIYEENLVVQESSHTNKWANRWAKWASIFFKSIDYPFYLKLGVPPRFWLYHNNFTNLGRNKFVKLLTSIKRKLLCE